MNMIEAVKHNLSNLTNFDGRDARSTFWWYVLFLLVVNFVAGMIISIPLMVSAVGSTMEAVQNGADPGNIETVFGDEMVGKMKNQMWFSAILGIAMVLLLAASFVRRLHDSGKPGWIALIVIALYVGSVLFNVMNFDTMIESIKVASNATDPQSMMRGQGELYSYGAMGYVAYLIVIVFGVFDSNRGPNRYGEEPDY